MVSIQWKGSEKDHLTKDGRTNGSMEVRRHAGNIREDSESTCVAQLQTRLLRL